MKDITEISQMLKHRAEEIARFLLPGGKRQGQEWCVGNLQDSPGDSLKIRLTGQKIGLWSDFASGQRGADLLDLWAAVKGITLAEALRQAKDYLGVTEPQFVGSRKKTHQRPQKPPCQRVEEGSEVWAYLLGRGFDPRLLPEVVQAYHLREGQGANGPEILFPYIRQNELLNVKYLSLTRTDEGKKRTRLESGCEMSLFGWTAIPDDAREVVICEGEIDALSWFQNLIPALSVPNGAKSFTWIENELENLERFETIYLSWDMDADGRAGVMEALDRLGRHRCRVVELPFKDANECLQQGVSATDMHRYLAQATSSDPSELKRASVYVEEVIREFYPVLGVEPGFPPPWSKAQSLLRFRPAEMSVWSGFSGTGKTTMLNQIILAGMDRDERACIASLEIKPRKLLKRMTRQATGQRLPDEDVIRATHSWYDDRLWLFELVGAAKVQRLFEVFEYARKRYGITQFVLDSLMRCGIDEDDYNGQKEIANLAAEFATTHDVHFHLVAHSRKRESESHEGSRLDVKGTGTITDLAHNVFIVWKNREKEKAVEAARAQGLIPADDILEKPDGLLICDKSREGEWTGKVSLWFEAESLQFVEVQGGRPYIYVRGEGSEYQESVRGSAAGASGD